MAEPERMTTEYMEATRAKLVEILTLSRENLEDGVQDDDALRLVLSEGDVLMWQSVSMLAAGVIVGLLRGEEDAEEFYQSMALRPIPPDS